MRCTGPDHTSGKQGAEKLLRMRAEILLPMRVENLLRVRAEILLRLRARILLRLRAEYVPGVFLVFFRICSPLDLYETPVFQR